VAFILFIIFLALAFDFINGFHDSANSIATVVGTRVLTPKAAVVWAAFFNFAAAFSLETRVANTIGKGIVDPSVVDPTLILAALVGAIVWNLLTWWWAFPSSSSHALIGGFSGAAIAKAGFSSLIFKGLGITGLFIFLSPLIGLVLGFTFFLIVAWGFRRASPDMVNRVFRRIQLVSAACFSFGHGMNDAQKTMGIIFALLVSTRHLSGTHIPFWIILICHAAIGLGTLVGGWRIVKTLSMRITQLKPVGGACAEFAGAATLIGSSLGGIPVSTTHTITGAIIGVGSARRLSAVRWGVARSIVLAWIFTIPFSALVAALVWNGLQWVNR
jgi:PiT family inorganic phosphate transporter